ncbi:MAG: DNA polymerase III subunit gamma/tau [Hyphomonadaceae bacterium]|nr:DNA polymerase III subunit gamma/tau [Hyphomonadaceae bacterium]
MDYKASMADSSPPRAYQVLARKYRPRTFADMIGQDVMITTLTNAFKAGRVAHAFMLTGVRGVGKTTAARLLARALNYETDTVDAPHIDLSAPGRHCERIMISSHMDVMEMDAASRTGVDNMRELLDGVRYAPSEARFKVYIIDEVHMLSTGAFNALLKTLEEPPDHAKFIFATTESRKVPITVLSRCQRFDLRRVNPTRLKEHISGICDEENVKISDGGLALISRAAEGSVRDALSLLDQAIVQGGLDGSEVTEEQIRDMLGLADRTRVLDLFAHAALGDGPGALAEIRSQYDDGADPLVIMRDLLDVCHEVSRAQVLGDKASFEAASDQIDRMMGLAEQITPAQMDRIWKMLLMSYEDVRHAPVPLAAVEMALLALANAGHMPPPELVAKLISEIETGNFTPPESLDTPPNSSPSAHRSVQASAQHAHTTQAITPPVTAPEAVSKMRTIAGLEEFVEALPRDKAALKYEVEKHIRLIRFKQGLITIENLTDAPPTLVGRMVEALSDLTGQLWLIDQESGPGEPSLSEQRRIAREKQDAEDRSHPAFSHPLLQGAELIDIRDIKPGYAADNIIPANFGQPCKDD